MAKSVLFQLVERTIEKLKSEWNTAYSERANVMTGSIIVSKRINELKKQLSSRVLIERNESGNLLIHAMSSLNTPSLSNVSIIIFDCIYEQIQQLSLAEQSMVLTTKKAGITPIKMALRLSNKDIIQKLISLVTQLNAKTKVSLLTGMDEYNDNINVAKYSRASLDTMHHGLSLLSEEQREELFTARDSDNRNALAYAVNCGDLELIRFLLVNINCAQNLDPEFLSDPTDSSIENAAIHLFILSHTPLVLSLKQFDEHDTLKKMLTTKGEGGRNALALAVHNNELKLVTALRSLVASLPDLYQTKIINQLSVDDRRKLEEFHPGLETPSPELEENESVSTGSMSPLRFFSPSPVTVQEDPLVKKGECTIVPI